MVAAPAVAQPAGEARARSSGATREARPDWAGAFTRTTVSRRNFNAPPDYALRSFRVEQRGAELRLLDEDGSVYRGVVLAAQPTAPGDSRITTFAGGTLPAGALAFRVYGTNQSAGRDLLFQGVLVTGATVRVQGQAILGGRDRIVVDAPGRAE
jgi:hypothetical protein